MKLPKMIGWVIAAALFIAWVAWQSPAQMQVIAYKGSLMLLSVVIAHLIDRSFFRKPTLNDEIARALVFIGVVVGFNLGL